jgi:hypothetical protein
VLYRTEAERLLLEKPQVGLRLARLLSGRLMTYEARMESLGLNEVPARLAGLLLLLVESEGLKTQTDFKLPFRYTHHQLGAMMGANREAVTRALCLAPGDRGRRDAPPAHSRTGHRSLAQGSRRRLFPQSLITSNSQTCLLAFEV